MCYYYYTAYTTYYEYTYFVNKIFERPLVYDPMLLRKHIYLFFNIIMKLNFTKRHVYSHDENRLKICFLCLGKCKSMFKIEGKLEMKLKREISDMSITNNLPGALCSTCRRNLYYNQSEKHPQRKFFFKLPDFSTFTGEDKFTRSNMSKNCKCYLCELARNTTCDIKKRKNKNSDRMEKSISKRCDKCFGEIKAGLSHPCTSSSGIITIEKYVQENFISAQKDQLVCKLLKTAKDLTIEDNMKFEMKQLKGKPLKVILNPKCNDNSVISVKSMCKIQTEFSLSQNTTLGIAKSLRIATSNRSLIESGLEIALSKNNHRVDEYFGITDIDFINKKKNIETECKQTVAYCTNLANLITYIENYRNYDDIHLRFGIDGGGGFLKLCLSILEKDFTFDTDHVEMQVKRRKYENNDCAKFLYSGVKKLFIIAIAPNTQENYANVSQLWKLSGINVIANKFSYTVASDLKLCNILCGLSTHSSSHPCTWCDVNKTELDKCGEQYRTLGSCLDYYNDWVQHGSKKKDAKNYKNCINPPIFSGDKDMKLLKIVPPTELHLMLGVVNTVVNKIETDFEEEANSWIKQCQVKREFTSGSGSTFNGNACKILLEKIDILRASCSIGCLQYVDVMQKFNNVVHDCFGMQLRSSYEKSIDAFKIAYLSTDLNVTPKVHCVFYHVKDFCSEVGRGLGFYSEQTVESSHHDFLNTWKNYKLGSNKFQYGNNLLQALRSYNSQHL